jgi:hypothetical protein
LIPSPAGRHRRANNPSSLAQHRIKKLGLLRTPLCVRDARGLMPPPAGRHRRTRPPPSPRSAPQASRPAINFLVYLPRSCSQPLWLQSVTDPLLLGAVGDNWNPERAFSAFLGVG